MSEIQALLSFSVLKESPSIIENKYLIAEKYMSECDANGWEYIHPKAGDQYSNLYKFILLSRSSNPIDEFEQIKTRTSPVYDYALGNDSAEVHTRHICLPIWYELEDEEVNKIMLELRN